MNKCDDELLNRIWAVAEHTFRLCSGIFFIDGIKRDKWIWCGDAYQSFRINRYLMADPDIDQRMLLARYFVGLRQTTSGGGFVVEPRLDYFQNLDCALPIGGGNGYVHISWNGSVLEADANSQGGVLRLGKDQYQLTAGPLYVIPVLKGGRQ